MRHPRAKEERQRLAPAPTWTRGPHKSCPCPSSSSSAESSFDGGSPSLFLFGRDDPLLLRRGVPLCLVSTGNESVFHAISRCYYILYIYSYLYSVYIQYERNNFSNEESFEKKSKERKEEKISVAGRGEIPKTHLQRAISYSRVARAMNGEGEGEGGHDPDSSCSSISYRSYIVRPTKKDFIHSCHLSLRHNSLLVSPPWSERRCEHNVATVLFRPGETSNPPLCFEIWRGAGWGTR